MAKRWMETGPYLNSLNLNYISESVNFNLLNLKKNEIILVKSGIK